MNTNGIFSSKTDNWATPQWLFDELNAKYGFTLDPCADDENHKCHKYFTVEDNGLSQNWGGVQSILQPTVWKRNWQMDKEVPRRSQEAGHGSGCVIAGTHGHEMVSRIHI